MTGKFSEIPLIAGGEQAQQERKFQLTPLGMISDKDEANEFTETPSYFSTIANVTFFSTKQMYYQACKKCRRKVVEEGEGFKCNSCEWEGKTCDVRFVATLKVADATGELWVTCYDPLA